MNKRQRLGLGCMGMNRQHNSASSLRTIHAVLDAGIRLLNTSEFYQGGDSEIIVGEALRHIPRDNYFLSVKFSVLPQAMRQPYPNSPSPDRSPNTTMCKA